MVISPIVSRGETNSCGACGSKASRDRSAPIAYDLAHEGKSSMQIYMFVSEATSNLHAFAGDSTGSKLPQNHGPWEAEGSLRSDQHPPHRFSRARIEEAIKLAGFQLWRMKQDG
jgi:hypothetical protein